MSFLDENGLTYFYGKLKEKFIQSVNTLTPDQYGNVTITNVATADNLTSPDAQASYGTFIYRTSGGSASLSSGEAQLVYIDGNIDIVGRVVENFNINATNDITTTYSANIWRSQINEDGTYVFTYIRPTSSATAMSWTSSGTWSYDGSQISMDSFGLYPTNVINPSINITTSGSGITGATVVPSTFFSQINTDATATFNYTQDEEESAGWMFNGTLVSLTTYGISISGNPTLNDTITVVSVVGTPNSTLTVNYTASQQGTITVATPTVFSATGFNQFDKNSMVLTNASFSGGKIIQNSGTYACYCHAKSGVDNGYVAYSESGAILDIGWCANIPTIGADIITTGQSVSTSLASIPFDDDGYVVVIASSTADICIHPKWSGSADTEYAAYVAPSTITIPTQDTNGVDLPTATYGMPKIGTIADRINLDAGTYIQRIGRLANTSSNMDYVISLETGYDYDDNYIYYVLPSAITYNINISPIYTVNDWGTEEFLDTAVPLSAQLLYGQNLRDKLRTDVVTISEQSLSQNQKNQICTNIGAVKKAGDTMTGGLTFRQTEIAVGDVPGNQKTISISGVDKNGASLGWVGYGLEADGKLFSQIGTQRTVNGSNVYNYLRFRIDSDGTRSITISEAAVWRTALGLGSMATVNSPVPVANGGTGGASAETALNNLGAFNIGGYGIALKAGDNVDTGLETGKTYYSGSSSISSTLAGTPPTTGSGFKIMQIRSYAAANYVYQIAFSSSEIFIRRRGASTAAWDAWWNPVKSTDTIAIGHGGTGQASVNGTTTVSSIATAGTNISITGGYYYWWGKVAHIRLDIKPSANISSGSTIATIVSGKRPALSLYTIDSADGRIEFQTPGTVVVRHALTSGTTYYITAVYLLA